CYWVSFLPYDLQHRSRSKDVGINVGADISRKSACGRFMKNDVHSRQRFFEVFLTSDVAFDELNFLRHIRGHSALMSWFFQIVENFDVISRSEQVVHNMRPYESCPAG